MSESEASLRIQLMALSKLTFDVYDYCEEAVLGTYSNYEFPGRMELVAEVWHEWSIGDLEGMDEIKDSAEYAQLIESLAAKMSADSAVLCVMEFLRALLLETGRVNDEVVQDEYDKRSFKEEHLSFRLDAFEKLFQFFMDAYHGEPTTRIAGYVTGLEPMTESLDGASSIPLEGICTKLSTFAFGSEKFVTVTRELRFSPETDQLASSETLTLFERIVTAMRVYYGPHVGVACVEKRLPLCKRQFPSTGMAIGIPALGNRSTKTGQTALKRFAAFWQSFGGSPSWQGLSIPLERLQRSPRSPEDRLIDLVIASDALLGDEGTGAEKLSLRFATFMQVLFGSDPRLTSEMVRASYRARNKIVHGEKTGRDFDLRHLTDLENLVRLTIAAFVCGGITEKSRPKLLLEIDAIVLQRLKGDLKVDSGSCPVIAAILQEHELLPTLGRPCAWFSGCVQIRTVRIVVCASLASAVI
jgi:hypothetical protein